MWEFDVVVLIQFAGHARILYGNDVKCDTEVQRRGQGMSDTCEHCQKWKALVMTDELTGLYNRRGLYDAGKRAVAGAQRYNHPLAAIMFDIDRFKHINDSYGHAVGDQVLAAVGQRCRTQLRTADILARYGGDEFVALLPETPLDAAHFVAERMRSVVANTAFHSENLRLQLSISLGVAGYHDKEPRTFDDLLKYADAAMYEAKRRGRGKVVVA